MYATTNSLVFRHFLLRCSTFHSWVLKLHTTAELREPTNRTGFSNAVLSVLFVLSGDCNDCPLTTSRFNFCSKRSMVEIFVLFLVVVVQIAVWLKAVLFYFNISQIPRGKFRSPYLNKARAAASATPLIPVSVCSIFLFPKE